MKKNKTILFTAVALVIFAAVSISGCKKADTDSTKPKACFTLSSETVRVIDTVTANAACSERATNYSWDSNFGFYNGSGNTVQIAPSGASGTMNITLTAANADGVDSITKTVMVRELQPVDYVGNYTCVDTCNDNSTYGPADITVIETNGGTSIEITGFLNSPFTVSFDMQYGVFTYQEPQSSNYYSIYGTLISQNTLHLVDSWWGQNGTVQCLATCRRN